MKSGFGGYSYFWLQKLSVFWMCLPGLLGFLISYQRWSQTNPVIFLAVVWLIDLVLLPCCCDFIFLVVLLHLTFSVKAWFSLHLIFLEMTKLLGWTNNWISYAILQVIIYCNLLCLFFFFYIIGLFISSNWWLHNFLYPCYFFHLSSLFSRLNHLHRIVFTGASSSLLQILKQTFPFGVIVPFNIGIFN